MSRCIVFDLDGTLADTSGDLIAAANACFADMGAATRLDPIADAGTALRGGRAMLTLGLKREFGSVDETIVKRYYPFLLQAYSQAIDVHTVLYEGALEAVLRLRALGDKVAICTNKPEGLANILMMRLGVRDHFDALIGADTLPTRKPDPAPLLAAIQLSGGQRERSVLVGDTVTDRETARAAAVPSILVEFGPSGADMAALEPDALLRHYNDLEDVLAKVCR